MLTVNWNDGTFLTHYSYILTGDFNADVGSDDVRKFNQKNALSPLKQRQLGRVIKVNTYVYA